MKFVHIADMHFDAPFSMLSSRGNFGEKRRMAQRNCLKKIIEYIKENKVEYFFISGDLWEHEYIRRSSIEYINALFEEIPNTLIFITPGNHDPFLNHSYYKTFKWGDNVKIFGGLIEKIELPGIDIYGYGFENFYCEDSDIEELEIENKNKINILITHGSLDGSHDDEKVYNPMKATVLKEKGFDYIALRTYS